MNFVSLLEATWDNSSSQKPLMWSHYQSIETKICISRHGGGGLQTKSTMRPIERIHFTGLSVNSFGFQWQPCRLWMRWAIIIMWKFKSGVKMENAFFEVHSQKSAMPGMSLFFWCVCNNLDPIPWRKLVHWLYRSLIYFEYNYNDNNCHTMKIACKQRVYTDNTKFATHNIFFFSHIIQILVYFIYHLLFIYSQSMFKLF